MSAIFLKSYSDPAKIPPGGLPQVAFIGRSNAGKSSLINALAGTKGLARVSNTPGRTRLVNVFRMGDFLLVDLPGYGYAKMSHAEEDAAAKMFEDYLASAADLRLAVVVLDSRLGPTVLDRDMIGQFAEAGMPMLLVANKVDKLSRSEMLKSVRSIQQAYPEATVIAHSAKTRTGATEILGAIRQLIRY